MYSSGAESSAPEYGPIFTCGYGPYLAVRHVLGELNILMIDVFIGWAFPIPVDEIFHRIVVGTHAATLADVGIGESREIESLTGPYTCRYSRNSHTVRLPFILALVGAQEAFD